ncbi:putative intracellular septation protein A [Methyloglobulus morosus KoM1]|uniref:Putative intracellular septation protein A n=1 Tax=Methyloglobulus morosus KoM1 TaxID=1116472 RepID=V5C073_9GAMM|nr:putative intracellular septation protein A [Methyloglobulus morosus]ESS73479.1 putative intracellular septation protein A [Methyloglobulus morosus KoM1]
MLKGILLGGLFLSYPFLIYKGMESGLNWLVPVIFSGIFLYRAWHSQELSARIENGLFAIALLAGTIYMQTITAKILPVFVQLMLMVFFGRTLFKDKGPPLIERIVRLQFPETPTTLNRYCWQLTLVWTAFFAVNALVCGALAIWGSSFWWVLYNGVVIYAIMVVLVIGEYVYRRIRFADLSVLHQGIPDPKATVKAMIINGRKVFLEMKER